MEPEVTVTPLSELLSNEPVAEVIDTPEPEAPSGPTRDEHGRFATKGVEPAETADTVPPTDKLPQDEYKAIREEREKRQTLEKELEALRNQIQQLQQPQEPPAPPPSIWDDEQGWQTHLQNQVLQQANQISRINASEMAARSQHQDFQEMFDLFNEMAGSNPQLVQQAMADPHPWGKAYQIAKNYKSMQDLAAVDVNDLRAKLKEELLAELQQGNSPVAPSIPATLSGERSVASRSGPAWAGPTPLSEILGRR